MGNGTASTYGGDGRDTFKVTKIPGTTDIISIWDFESRASGGLDTIDLTALDADTNVSGRQAFVFASGEETPTGGVYGKIFFNTTTYELISDVDGDGTIDLEIRLTWAARGLTKDDLDL